MKSIGIIGQGFVGVAVRDCLRHHFSVYTYDKKNPLELANYAGEKRSVYEEVAGYFDPVSEMFKAVDGPVFVCVPTPMSRDGSCDTSIVESVVSRAEECCGGSTPTLVIKSTIVPGTTRRLAGKYGRVRVCFNPEFLTEANASEDFRLALRDHVIIGGDPAAVSAARAMYLQVSPSLHVSCVEPEVAELAKYATNCFLATKVSFANELRALCEAAGADYNTLANCLRQDHRLGRSHWAVPGPDGNPGFGGSCFPKDVNAVLRYAVGLGVDMRTLAGAWETNLSVRPGRDWERLVGRAVNYGGN